MPRKAVPYPGGVPSLMPIPEVGSITALGEPLPSLHNYQLHVLQKHFIPKLEGNVSPEFRNALSLESLNHLAFQHQKSEGDEEELVTAEPS